MMKPILSLLVLSMLGSQALAYDLEGYLDQVVRKHRGLEALRSAREASAAQLLAGDLDLVPALSLSRSYLSDKKQPNSLGASETRVNEYNVSLSKKFSTGTQVRVFAKSGEYENLDLSGAIPIFAQFKQYAQGSLGLSVSQSLWKDAFGHGTRLRDSRLSTSAAYDIGSDDLQARQILTAVEATYWDYIYTKNELKIRQSSLERAQKIESWIQRRVSDGISDRADLLSAQALTASRKLQLASTEDDLVALEKRMRDDLELNPTDPLPEVTGSVTQAREIRTLVGGSGKVVRLDSWLASLDAKVRAISAEEAAEAVKADLNLSGSYNTNSFTPGGVASDGTTDLNKTDHPTTQVALTWTYLFDTDVKDASQKSVRKAAEAAKLVAERKALEGETAWNELNRRYSELGRRIKSASIVQQIQSDRAKAQADKLARGRSVTSDVINSEQDAAEAALQLTKMQAEQRKLEAQSRLFVTVKETP